MNLVIDLAEIKNHQLSGKSQIVWQEILILSLFYYAISTKYCVE